MLCQWVQLFVDFCHLPYHDPGGGVNFTHLGFLSTLTICPTWTGGGIYPISEVWLFTLCQPWGGGYPFSMFVNFCHLPNRDQWGANLPI